MVNFFLQKAAYMLLAAKIILTPIEEILLTNYSKSQTESVRLDERSKIILLAATIKTNIEISTELRCSHLTVRDKIIDILV
jgi:hypothetical protein